MNAIINTSTSLVPVAEVSQQPPAIKKPVNKFKLFTTLNEEADDVLTQHAELVQTERTLQRCITALEDARTHQRPVDPAILTDFANIGDVTLSEYSREQVACCREAMALLDPDDNYDDDGCLKKSIVAKRLSLLIGAFPMGTPATPEVYTKMLVEHIANDNEVTYLALESACREITTQQKFLPTISEVLEVLETHNCTWSSRKRAIHNLKRLARELADSIAEAKPKFDAEATAQKIKQKEMSLEFARAQAVRAADDVKAKQQLAAKAAQEVKWAFERLAAWQVKVARVEQALATSVISKS
jgi:hypothetical protein